MQAGYGVKLKRNNVLFKTQRLVTKTHAEPEKSSHWTDNDSLRRGDAGLYAKLWEHDLFLECTPERPPSVTPPRESNAFYDELRERCE